MIIDDSLGFTVSVLGWLLPENHEIYLNTLRSVRNIKVSNLLSDLEALFLCPGVKVVSAITSELKHHVVQKLVDPLYDDIESFPSKEYWRAVYCHVLYGEDGQC